jgi:hypothetical protein
MKSETQVQSWRAIEALRAGVPNRDAVRALGSSQPVIEDRFRTQLTAVKDGFSQGIATSGTLIAGDFGSGKSHLLEYLQHIALENNFVCSKVVISKETPLHDPAKVYSAAIQSATAPDRAGAALEAVASQLDFNSPKYNEFYQWVNSSGNGLSTRFAATVCVFDKGKGFRAPEISDKIIQFWSGSPIAVIKDLRDWLREMGEAATYKIDRVPPLKELALQRYQFVPRLMVAAGYAGWVILVDEVELIGRYSLRQRAKSYAELARWMGKLEGHTIPGLTAVLAITTAFESEVINERNDEENIPGRLRARGGDAELLVASQAERGMRTIQRDKVLIEPPTEANIREIYEKVVTIYATAYDWEPPTGYGAPDRTARIRQHIKRWITEWDLKRLYPDHNQVIEVEVLGQDLSEMSGLEEPPEDSPDEGGGNS